MQDVSAHIPICEKRPSISAREGEVFLCMRVRLFVVCARPIAAGQDAPMASGRLLRRLARRKNAFGDSGPTGHLQAAGPGDQGVSGGCTHLRPRADRPSGFRGKPAAAGRDPLVRSLGCHLQTRSFVARPRCVSPHLRGRELYADVAVTRDLAGSVAATASTRIHALEFHFESAVMPEVR